MSNFSARFLISTLGRLKEKNDWQDLTILILSCGRMDGTVMGMCGLEEAVTCLGRYDLAR